MMIAQGLPVGLAGPLRTVLESEAHLSPSSFLPSPLPRGLKALPAYFRLPYTSSLMCFLSDCLAHLVLSSCLLLGEL